VERLAKNKNTLTIFGAPIIKPFADFLSSFGVLLESVAPFFE
jgi:hypothetical protein